MWWQTKEEYLYFSEVSTVGCYMSFLSSSISLCLLNCEEMGTWWTIRTHIWISIHKTASRCIGVTWNFKMKYYWLGINQESQMSLNVLPVKWQIPCYRNVYNSLHTQKIPNKCIFNSLHTQWRQGETEANSVYLSYESRRDSGWTDGSRL